MFVVRHLLSTRNGVRMSWEQYVPIVVHGARFQEHTRTGVGIKSQFDRPIT
jgi:hypothetical protein